MDGIERLECVYYPGPVPCDSAVLTVLCFLFDKVHFPNVYLPMGDYDKGLLQEEINRLQGLRTARGERLAGIFRFLECRLPLDGILEYPSPRDSQFKTSEALAQAIYDANHPPRKYFHPMLHAGRAKSLPGSAEAVKYAGDFHYQAGAIAYAAEKGLPLLDDGSVDQFRLVVPFRARYKDNAQSLAIFLAVESLGLELPDLPPMTPEEIVEFRADNVKELQNFRASMLRYAKTLNDQISDDPSIEELNRKAKFFIESEIRPALHDLSRDLQNPNRPFRRRMGDVARITSSVVAAFLTGGALYATAAEAITRAALSDLEAKGDKREAVKRNGLYYLLKARALRA